MKIYSNEYQNLNLKNNEEVNSSFYIEIKYELPVLDIGLVSYTLSEDLINTDDRIVKDNSIFNSLMEDESYNSNMNPFHISNIQSSNIQNQTKPEDKISRINTMQSLSSSFSMDLQGLCYLRPLQQRRKIHRQSYDANVLHKINPYDQFNNTNTPLSVINEQPTKNKMNRQMTLKPVYNSESASYSYEKKYDTSSFSSSKSSNQDIDEISIKEDFREEIILSDDFYAFNRKNSISYEEMMKDVKVIERKVSPKTTKNDYNKNKTLINCDDYLKNYTSNKLDFDFISNQQPISRKLSKRISKISNQNKTDQKSILYKRSNTDTLSENRSLERRNTTSALKPQVEYRYTNIINVDDENCILKINTRLFGKEGYELNTCKTGDDLICLINWMTTEDYFNEKQVVVIMDYRLEQEYGDKVIQRAREFIEDTNNVKFTLEFVALTSTEDLVVIKNFERLNVLKIYKKPLKKDYVKEIIKFIIYFLCLKIIYSLNFWCAKLEHYFSAELGLFEYYSIAYYRFHSRGEFTIDTFSYFGHYSYGELINPVHKKEIAEEYPTNKTLLYSASIIDYLTLESIDSEENNY